MKIRTILMAVVFLAAASATFGSSAKRFGRSAFFILGSWCDVQQTTQNNCQVYNSGPVCTVNFIGNEVTAYNMTVDGGTPCTIPLRQL